MNIFEEVIVPWLKDNGVNSEEEFSLIKSEGLNTNSMSNPELSPFFQSPKNVFKLAEMLLISDLREMASDVIKYIRSVIYNSSTYKTLIGSLSNLEDLVVLNHILEIWFPSKIDILSAIHNLVDLRMGEDVILEFIDIIWDRTVPLSSDKLVDAYLGRIVISAMQEHYVSVFEDILERRPGLIDFINSHVSNKSTIVHIFCQNPDHEDINKLKVGFNVAEYLESRASTTPITLSSSPTSPSLKLDSIWLDHRRRSYPDANKDLLLAMIRHGANINARDSNGFTPLHIAILHKNAHIFRLLLETGADYKVLFNYDNIFSFFRKHPSSSIGQVLKELFPSKFSRKKSK